MQTESRTSCSNAGSHLKVDADTHLTHKEESFGAQSDARFVLVSASLGQGSTRVGSGKSLQAQVQLHHEAAHCNTYSEGSLLWMSLFTQAKPIATLSCTLPHGCRCALNSSNLPSFPTPALSAAMTRCNFSPACQVVDHHFQALRL